MVAFEIRDGTLSGISTLMMICIGVAPMLSAASITPGFTSRMQLSASLAMNGNDAITSGTMDATVPTGVPTMSLVSGMTMIIRIRKGTERSRLMHTSRIVINHLGRGRMPSLPPTANRIPKGSPITIAIAVETTVT